MQLWIKTHYRMSSSCCCLARIHLPNRAAILVCMVFFSCKLEKIPEDSCFTLLSELNCSNASVYGSLFRGQLADSVSVIIPYRGGDGKVCCEQSIASTGVLGLFANLEGVKLLSDSGAVEFSISGTPLDTGTAYFLLELGGQSCSLSIPIQPAIGSITGLDCGEYKLSGALFPGASAENSTITLPYSGGNGGLSPGEVITSVGVNDLTASLDTVLFNNGSGTITYHLSGIPQSAGIAFFPLNVGGQSCTLSIPVGCGAYIGSGEWKEFSCYNLGAANTSADPFTPSWEINGGYWQWGTAQEAAAGPVGPESPQSNAGAINGWNTGIPSNNLWSDTSKTIYDPCPSNFRVPSKAQWERVIESNLTSWVGTWNNSASNFSAGIFFGNNLYLPAAGLRLYNDGHLDYRGSYGYYWSSSKMSSESAWFYYSNGANAGTSDLGTRAYGQSIRCIKE